MQPWRGFPRLSGRSTAGESDAENRLVSVTIKATGHRSEFGYDGMGRRVSIVEKDLDATQTLQVASDKKYLWDGVEIAEERSADGTTVTKRFYAQGFVDNDGTTLFYTRDHLGSIRELTDSAQAVRARYDYDPYGRMTKIQGDRDSVFGYATYFWHQASGLMLSTTRAYDPNTGRFISREEMPETYLINTSDVGIHPAIFLHRYGYCQNDPINQIDPDGRLVVVLGLIVLFGVVVGFYLWTENMKVPTKGPKPCKNPEDYSDDEISTEIRRQNDKARDIGKDVKDSGDIFMGPGGVPSEGDLLAKAMQALEAFVKMLKGKKKPKSPNPDPQPCPCPNK